MKKISPIEQLKKSNCKLTAVRMALLNLFLNHTKPQSVPQIIEKLHILKMKPNKSTIYREIDFLLKENIIKEINLGKRVKFYELKNKKKHYHLLCLKCGNIFEIEADSEIEKKIKKIASKTKFELKNITISFFGYCEKCKKK